MAFFKTLAGPGYIVLNVIRIMNITSLLAVIGANSVMLVKTFVVSKFFFFDGVTHVVEVWISIFLIISELPLFRSWFMKHWPMFGHESGFIALGTAMLILGNSILAYLNKDSTKPDSLGLPFWRLVISAGIVAMVMGLINIFASWVFADRENNVSARQVRIHGAVAKNKVAEDKLKQAEQGFMSPSLKLHRRESLPSYYSRQPTPKGSTTEITQKPPKLPLTISRPIIASESPASSAAGHFAKSPAGPTIAEPNLAHHPAMYSDRI